MNSYNSLIMNFLLVIFGLIASPIALLLSAPGYLVTVLVACIPMGIMGIYWYGSELKSLLEGNNIK